MKTLPNTEWPLLVKDTFVRVRADIEDPAAGLDGMVVCDADSEGNVGLLFGYDRHNSPQNHHRTGRPELWHVDELDLTTAY